LTLRRMRCDAQNSPEVLKYDDEMVSEMLDQIRNQVGSP
jgi:hypothetical protein